MAATNTPARGLGISFREVNKRYGAVFALRGVTFRVEPGEFVAVAGHNGSGKTTLLRIAAQLSRVTEGEVGYLCDGGELCGEEARPRLGMVAHSTMTYDELTAEENLTFLGKLYGLPDATAQARAALEPAGLSGRAEDLVRTFSRGMRQRLAIARALLTNPGLLLFDEPATGLDPEGQNWLRQTLARLSATGCTIVMSTHEQGAVHPGVTRAMRLERGRVIADSAEGGTPGEVLGISRARQASPAVTR